MPTPNFGIRDLLTTDLFDEIVVSEGMVKSDVRLSEREDVIVTADADITLTNTGNVTGQVCNWLIRVRDPSTLLTATRDLIFPAGMKGEWDVHNLTGQTLQARPAGGAFVSVPAGDVHNVLSDGVDMFDLGSSSSGGGGGGSSIIYDFSFFFWQKPVAGAEIMRIVWNKNITIPAGMPLSQGNSAVATTNPTTYDIRKNGVSVGSADFAAAAVNATFSMVSATSFAPGDTLEMIAPSPQDATQENIGFMMHAERV